MHILILQTVEIIMLWRYPWEHDWVSQVIISSEIDGGNWFVNMRFTWFGTEMRLQSAVGHGYEEKAVAAGIVSGAACLTLCSSALLLQAFRPAVLSF